MECQKKVLKTYLDINECWWTLFDKKNIFNPKNVINLYTYYLLRPQLRNLDTDFTIVNCLFRSVKITKNADPEVLATELNWILVQNFYLQMEAVECHYVWSWYELIVPVDKKGKDILIFGEGPTQVLDDTSLTEETKYCINFSPSGKRFVLSPQYDGSNSFLFLNATKVYQFKANNSLIKDYGLCLGNVQNILQLIIWKKKQD